jgi:antitoxin ParD1/3/4
MQSEFLMKNTSVTLGEHFDAFIAEQLDRGRYRSASEMLREGLRLLEEREVKLAVLRAALMKGEASGFTDFSFEELKRTLDQETTNQGAA